MRLATIMLLTGFLQASGVHAAPTGSAVLKLSPSAQAYALGRTDAVSAQGAQAMHANPANLHRMNGRIELFSAFMNLMEDAQYGHATLSLNRSPSGKRFIDALAVSVTHLKVGDVEGRDNEGNRTGDSFGSGDTIFGIGMASRFHSGIRIGATAKGIQSEIAGYKSDLGLAADVGMNYDTTLLSRAVSLGLSANNLGRGTKFISQRDPLPTSLNAGASVGLGPVAGMIQVSRQVNDKMTDVRFGMEYGFGPVALRAGYRTQNGAAETLSSDGQGNAAKLMEGLTTGLGLRVGSATMDYALSQEVKEFGLSHRIALTIQWGKGASTAEVRRAPAQEKSAKRAVNLTRAR